MAQEKIEYILEYSRPGKVGYSKSFRGYDEKEYALNIAKTVFEDVYKKGNSKVRVVEQKRKVIKVFKC